MEHLSLQKQEQSGGVWSYRTTPVLVKSKHSMSPQTFHTSCHRRRRSWWFGLVLQIQDLDTLKSLSGPRAPLYTSFSHRLSMWHFQVYCCLVVICCWLQNPIASLGIIKLTLGLIWDHLSAKQLKLDLKCVIQQGNDWRKAKQGSNSTIKCLKLKRIKWLQRS